MSAPSMRPPSAGALRTRRPVAAAIFLSLVGLLGFDWFAPLQGTLSQWLLIATSLLSAAWTLLMIRERRVAAVDDAKTPRTQDVSHTRAVVLKLALSALQLSFLAAKWVVQVRSTGDVAGFVGSSRTYTLGLGLLLVLGFLLRDLRAARFLAAVSEYPARLMAVSFGGVGLVGAMLLSLPVAVHSVGKVSLVDSVFMAFSAVCVTGLSVTNVATTYTLFGQAVLLVLVQIGGLGIMVLSAVITILAGQRLLVKSSAMLTEIVDGASLATLRRTLFMICLYTLAAEACGAAALYVMFLDHPQMSSLFSYPLAGADGALWAAVFHAVSAFCNAGFSNLEQGLLPFGAYPTTLSVLCALIVLGGVGFPVLDELARLGFKKLTGRKLPMLSLHSRVVLRFSALLLGCLAAAYCALEWSAALGQLPYSQRLMTALFQSASARTAGFNVIDIGLLQPATLVLTCAAMFVGAAPGSTAGGIKVTTVAALFAGLRAELQASPPRLLNRVLPDTVIKKAIGVVFLSLLIVFIAFFLLLLTETHPPLSLLFEVLSAFSTTGLSTGITPQLSTWGKWIITLMMFVGRIGPITLALAVSIKAERRPVQLPSERLLIG